jgi:hypothetical protein
MTDKQPIDTTADERQQTIESLFVQNYTFIRELIFSDPAMTLEGEQQITEGIAAHLPSYDGKLTDAEFRAWLTEIIVPLVGFHAIKRVCQPFVRAAIWRTLGQSAEPNRLDDYSELLKELSQDVWLWVYLYQDKLRKPGLAKITTRVYERAAIMTKAWLKKQRTRRSAVIRRVYDLPPKSKANDAAEKLALEMDREALERAERYAETKEIIEEMKKLEMVA